MHVSLPEGRTDALLSEQVGEETVVYDLTNKDVHCLSPLASAVFARCDGRTAPARIAEVAQERLGRPVSVDEVSAAISQLAERSLLTTPPLVQHAGNGFSRRDLVKKSAVVGGMAFAAPLITSIAAPTAAMAAGYIPTGCTGCGGNSDCVSNHCCQTNPGKECNQSCCVGNNNSCHRTNCNPLGCDTAKPAPPICRCDCTVLLSTSDCNAIVCPPTSTKCCTPT